MSASAPPTPAHRAVAFALIGGFTTLLIVTAWVGDDAYIMLRTVDNLLHGFGPRWNVEERVQTYTEPLWTALVALVVSVSREYYFTVLALSGAVALSSYATLVTRLSPTAAAAAVTGGLACLSKTFVEYSTSGLGSTLSYLLLFAFALRVVRGTSTSRALVLASFLAGLGVLNRMDTVLMYAPALAAVWWPARRDAHTWVAIAAAVAPIFAWEAFSLAYYGFAFPNTAYAKLTTGIPGTALARQGIEYLLNAIELDTPTVATIGGGLVAAALPAGRRFLPLAFGALVYVAYVVRVGGDCMMGRFLGVPFCVAVVVLSQLAWSWRRAALVLAVGLTLSMAARRPILFSTPEFGDSLDASATIRGVGDQRYWFYESTGLLSTRRTGSEPTHRWVEVGRRLRRKGAAVLTYPTVGMMGFYAGPEVVVIDTLALCDALLARLPAGDPDHFIIGHFWRVVPDGYEASVREGRNLIGDPDLARYYEALREVTRGPLWSSARWGEIWRFHVGDHDDELRAYVARHPQATRGD